MSGFYQYYSKGSCPETLYGLIADRPDNSSGILPGAKYYSLDESKVYIYTGISPDYWMDDFSLLGSGSGGSSGTSVYWGSSQW